MLFCFQPIKIPNISDQENVNANESDTDPQPACTAPRKTLPGKVVLCVFKLNERESGTIIFR